MSVTSADATKEELTEADYEGIENLCQTILNKVQIVQALQENTQRGTAREGRTVRHRLDLRNSNAPAGEAEASSYNVPRGSGTTDRKAIYESTTG